MPNQIDRDAFVKRDVLKNPIPYTRGTDLLPIVIHFRDFQIPSGATARVFVAKPDGNAVYTTATIDGNDVTVDVTDQMFIELGMALMQISIMDGEEELVSFVQPVDVKQNLKAGDFPESITDVSFLDDAIEQANEAVNTATAAAQQAATAVQNANTAVSNANDAIEELNKQIASLNNNFATLAQTVSISQLQTTAKNLVGAVNELNSKSFLLQGGTAISSNSDMNNYTEIGNYYANSGIAQSLQNAPFNHSFTMKIDYGNGTGYICQTYREIDTGRIAIRYNNNQTANVEQWQPYVYFSDDATVLSNIVFSNAGSHNSIYRGKSLGSSVTTAQWNAISAGTFDDLYIGDYWTIGGVNWRIAAFDYYYNTGDTAFTKHHAVIVPDTSLYTHVMNDTNITTGAYVGSKMYTEGLEQAKTTISNAFGSSHVLSHRIYLSNATSNGKASDGAWADSTVDLMCEHMVYGSGIFSPVSDGSTVPNNYRVEKSQLPLFAHNPRMIGIRSTWWLRDVITSADFAYVHYNGTATCYYASLANGVRPAFCIGV